jgi:hypothetical protein
MEHPIFLFFSNGVLNCDGVLKLGDKLEGCHATHFLS